MRRSRASLLATVVALGIAVWLCAGHADEVIAALGAVPAWGFGAAVAAHVATLALRSEAWGLTLASIADEPLPRRWVHGANAAAFLAGTVQSQAALPARVAMLRRLAGARAPRPLQIAIADVPIFALELCAAAVLLFVAALAGFTALWVAPAALALGVAVLLGARHAPARFAHRPMVRGLAVLADRRRRGRLVALVAALCAVSAGRVWIVLLVCGLPHGLGEVGWVVAALGVFGLLPFGPAAPAAAMVATLGTATVGAAIAGGLVIGATSIAGVVVYALVVGLGTLSVNRPMTVDSPLGSVD